MAQWEHFVVQAVQQLHSDALPPDIPWFQNADGVYAMDESQWPEGEFGALDMPALQAAAEVLAAAVTSEAVNLEILENLKLIWGGDTETRVAQHHQNAVGVLGRLVNKELTTGAAPTGDEIALKEGIDSQLNAHESILTEGRRIKALSPIPADYKDLLAAVV